MQKITPFLWYEDKAEEAANFYVSLFPNSKVKDITHYDESMANAAGRPVGSVMTVDFELAGEEFVAMNAGPAFKFTEAISFTVNCEDQEEVDKYWDALTADGGQESMCGWLKDKYGLSWQITPTILVEMMKDKNTAKAKKVLEAMLQMKKIDIPTLKHAYEQG